MFSNLFAAAPGQSFSYYLPIAIFGGILILGGLIFGHIYKKKKKTDFAFKRIFKKLSQRLVLMGILFLFLLLVRYENIPYFSMRLWLYISILLLTFFTYLYLKKWRVDYPREKDNVAYKRAAHSKKKKSEKRYLPNKKRK